VGHRVAAASRLGRAEIEAEIHEGDCTEAMVAAIIANTKHGIPLSTAERDEGIVRLARAGWAKRRIARELSLSPPRVRAILDRGHLGAHLPANIADSAVRAPREYRLPVAERAADGRL